MHYLDGLNDAQKQAVQKTEGPLLIVAGAGAGKTRVIVHRILHLIASGVPPESILALTFTNKAATEMRERVQTLLARSRTLSSIQLPTASAQLPWLGTFHSLGVRLIRENAHTLGLPKRFAIFDRADSLSAIKKAVKTAGLDPKSFEPSRLLAAISREKGNMVTEARFAERASEYYPRIVSEVWKAYEKILAEERALDFDDLLLKTALLLAENTPVRDRYSRTWQYLHIDEYQDTNRVQYEIARLLAETHRNIAVVGDVDQNIYSWRGATIRNILDFQKEYPDALVVLLQENYRSTQRILAAANEVIKKNKERVEKTLFTKKEEGEKIGLCSAYDEADEARFVAGRAKELIASGISPREIAVLFRANFQSRALEEAFLSSEVPHQVVGVRFFERREVKDMLAYVRAALDPGSISDVRRVLNVPPRGIGKMTLLKILAGQESALPEGVRERVRAFRQALTRMRRALTEKKLSEALRFILAESGLERVLKEGTEDDLERLENIRELVTFALRYDALPPEEAVERFLTDAALQSDQDELDEKRDAVRLMTVHAAKGLEFAYVFIAGLEQDLFPHARLDTDERLSQEKAEEERRLFYVALTRAKKKLFLSYASVRTIFGARRVNLPSEFIFDIPEEHLEAEEAPAGASRTVYLD